MKFNELKAMIEGMSRKQANDLADRAKVGKTTIAHIRKGRTDNPRIETVERLIAALEGKPKRKPAEKVA